MSRMKSGVFIVVVMLLSLVVLVGCGSQNQDDSQRRITALPSATFTPRSTELPIVPTPQRIGSEELPIQLAFFGETSPEVNRVIGNLEDALMDEMSNFDLGFYEGITLEIRMVDDKQDMLTLLCNSPRTAVFADAFTFYAAQQQCGAQPVFQVIRDGESGQNFDLVVFRQRIFTPRDLRGRPFCAKDYQDFTSFIHPMMALRAEGVNPFDDFSEIFTGFDEDIEMVLAVSGRYQPGQRPLCDAAAISAGTYDAILDELLDEDREENLTENQANSLIGLLDPTWSQIPYELLVFPPDRLFPPYLRAEMERAFTNIQDDDGDAKEDLQFLIPHDDLRPVQTINYQSFLDWMDSTGWDLAVAAR